MVQISGPICFALQLQKEKRLSNEAAVLPGCYASAP
ncbi:hypothetical protein FOQG_08699 [Fusarium oxysporum f. sp. raphani 54005]|uniref:Uncharacterized protein n=8 Tax=Fusarium oxysporum TaxID=5507 RepID=W9IPX9_FUSOX|nr:hypothetical protein FOXG_19151 [Fusarium oxysporum f. sp. lycopersici 4287]EWY95375.1 hypothetical protein FOYG_04439 [Fusarium oxysporum NRRL 32931]EWZ42824.1 hypothetical protein FOZG_07633 [Fusarium oxysporum Fo47]EXA00086.1 hypothetical protein FOWG_00417 [Fusarium oxysporum f. sp. lycopersici MN25]EXA46897.1 hypothetical protein FOVG_04189 [Fusarium oxysporum f. sp. pisi HDV247]EXK33063.1 hypothetical protein FOMG_11851 [Fusarium oxysporum f. sp. melonis 26406]EXK87802.1 hypothetical